MSLDKYQQAWKAEASQVKVTFDANLLSKEVWKSRETFRSLIFWRDVREVGTSLVMIPIWFVMGNIVPVPWTWWLTVPVFLWIAGFHAGGSQASSASRQVVQANRCCSM